MSSERRSVSAPIPIPRGLRASSTERSYAMAYSSLARSQLSNVIIRGASDSSKECVNDVSLDITGLLQRSEPLVVKNRTGSVLSRGFILKTDHYPSGTYFSIT